MDTHNHASSWNPELSCNLKNLFTQREEYFYTRQARFCMRRQLRKKQDHRCTYNRSTEWRKRTEKSHLRFSFTAGFGGWRDDASPCQARGRWQRPGGRPGSGGSELGPPPGANRCCAPSCAANFLAELPAPAAAFSPSLSSSSPFPQGAGLLRFTPAPT